MWNKKHCFFAKGKFCWAGMHGACIHPVGRALSSDWSENCFVIVVFMEKTFVVPLDRKFWLRMKNNFLIDNHYKTIYGLVRIECSPCRVELWSVPDTRIGFKSRFRLHCHYRFFFKFLVSKDKNSKILNHQSAANSILHENWFWIIDNEP